MVLSRSRSKFDKLIPSIEEKKLPTSSDKLHFISMDLASVDDIKRAGVDANEWAGGCADILVNNGESLQQGNWLLSILTPSFSGTTRFEQPSVRHSYWLYCNQDVIYACLSVHCSSESLILASSFARLKPRMQHQLYHCTNYSTAKLQ